MAFTIRPTVGQVATLAGVSVASVSRVLNGLPASPEMTARVHRAVNELGYAPDAMARSLKVRRTEQLSLVVADAGNPAYVTMMRAVAEVVRQAGYRLVLASGESDPEAELQMVRGLAGGYADGMILSPIRVTDELLAELRTSRMPVAVVGTVPDDAGVDNVRADSAKGVRLALRHLVDTGRTRIGFINGPIDTVPGTARQRGFERGLKRAGARSGADIQVVADDFTFDAGFVAAQKLLHTGVPEAVLAANDLLAVGAMHAFIEAGLEIPWDVAIVGMDNTDLGKMVTPGLTSVDLGSAARGAMAATMLLERLAAPDRPVRHVLVPPKLVVRGSTAPATAARQKTPFRRTATHTMGEHQ